MRRSQYDCSVNGSSKRCLIVYLVHKTLDGAIGGDATAAAEMWRAIADGRASPAEAATWAQYVAKRVVGKVIDADLVSSNRRADAALKAIGFYGPIDRDRHLREDLASIQNDEVLRARPRVEKLEVLRLLTDELDGVPTKNALKKIDRLLKK